MATCAAVWLATCSALSTASNWLTRSAELTICLPRPRRNSTVPASTIETYMMALLGEYCMATVWAFERIGSAPCPVPANWSTEDFSPCSESSLPCSIRWTSFCGSPKRAQSNTSAA